MFILIEDDGLIDSNNLWYVWSKLMIKEVGVMEVCVRNFD